jgi:hypothetical protein
VAAIEIPNGVYLTDEVQRVLQRVLTSAQARHQEIGEQVYVTVKEVQETIAQIKDSAGWVMERSGTDVDVLNPEFLFPCLR